MLARNFKTAAKLGISEGEHRALIAVLYQLERGELDGKFNMASWDHCICGYARKFDEESFPSLGLQTNDDGFHWMPEALAELFHFTPHTGSVTTAHAAQALNNYLVTGKPDWESVIFPISDPTLCRSRSA